MIGDDLDRMLEAVVRLELNISRLYLRYHQLLPEDGPFWWRLSLEEKNHAALLRSADQLAAVHGIPDGMLPERLEDVLGLNARVEACIAAASAGSVDRAAAFRCALELERSAGEVHFQTFMESAAEGGLARVFRSLNQGDMDHAGRVGAYMEEHGIS